MTSLRGALCLTLLASACGGGAPSGPPDVLLISVDTLRADRVSAWGYGRRTTPSIDALAERGVRFADAVAPSSHTAPSHLSIFTGADPQAHGVRNVVAQDTSTQRINDRWTMLPEVFQEAGYRTAIVGDSGNVHPDLGFDRGFDRTEFEMLAIPEKLPIVEDIIAETDAEQPLFLFFHTYQVHAPYLPPPRYFGRFTDRAYDGPFRERYDGLAGRPMGVAFKLAGNFLSPFDGLGERDVRWLSDLYDENLLAADEGLGELIATWERERGRDGWIVLFSDHGEEFFEHGRLGHKRGLERVLTHVPLVVVGPRAVPGVVESTTSLTGLATTLAELCGLDPTPFAAPSFASAVLDPASMTDAGAAFQQLLVPDGEPTAEAFTRAGLNWIRTGDRTLLERYAASAGTPDEALLDERLDQRRTRNLDRLSERPPTAGRDLSEQRRRQLEALGYAGED